MTAFGRYYKNGYFCYMNYRIYPPEEILEATVSLPLSKSVSNRALIINALTDNAAPLARMAECSDTIVLQHALSTEAEKIDIGDAGTAMRFLTAYFAALDGRSVRLDGNDRMRRRPIGPLVDALRHCGAEIDYLGEKGFPPLHISGHKLAGGNMEIDATVSSQYISALLMIAPLMAGGLHISLAGEAISLPYIDLTIDLMCRAGVTAERYGNEITVNEGRYSSVTLPAEGDWSAASYWYEIVSLTGGFLTLKGLNGRSQQPDRRAMEIFGSLGAVSSPGEESPDDIDLCGSPDVSPRLVADMSPTPDLTPAVAVTCAMIGVPFRLSGLQSLRIKETDRIAAIATELKKIGVHVEIIGDHTMQWEGRRLPIIERPVFDTYGDHRMAMALAPVAIYIPGIEIKDAEVVGKSYPAYWDALRQAGFQVIDATTSENETDYTPETDNAE